jgi:hypothetical protein
MALPFGSGFSPLQGEPRMGLIPIPYRVATLATLTTGGGVRTATAAEVLGGLFVLNVDDAQTMTLPTGALLNAAIPGCVAGASFEFVIINTGDATLTVAIGSGGTLATGSNSKNSVATVTSNSSSRWLVVITSVLQAGDSSDGYTVYRIGVDASAVS